MHNISSCSLCEKSVNDRSSIKSNLCQTISHLKCNDLNYVDDLYLKNSNISGIVELAVQIYSHLQVLTIISSIFL